MSSVDDVYAAASGAEEPLENAQGQITTASQKTGEAAVDLEAAKDQAEKLVESSNALGLETKAAEAAAVRAELEGLAVRTAAAVPVPALLPNRCPVLSGHQAIRVADPTISVGPTCTTSLTVTPTTRNPVDTPTGPGGRTSMNSRKAGTMRTSAKR